MRIDQALAQATARLEQAGSDSPRFDAELLLCHVLEQGRSYLFTWADKALSDEQQAEFETLLARREQGAPVAHLTGTRGFWTLELEVTPDTLIPRPDTECLVELALEKLPPKPARVADLGTGTGAIALALASECPAWQVTGCDRIPAAAELATRNAKRLNIRNAEFVTGSWFEPLSGQFDLIVSNPPYIDPQDEHLAQGDVRFEPLSALIADDQGLADIRHIAATAPQYLLAGGWLMVEHGYDQGEAVRAIFTANGFEQVATEQDYGNRDRVTLGRLPL